MEDFKSPELSKIKKTNPFKVPDNYFDDFSARLQIRIEAESKAGAVKQNRIIHFLKPAIGIAASFGLIFMLLYWPVTSILPDKLAGTKNTNSISKDYDFEIYVEGIDENSFYALLEEPNSNGGLAGDDLVKYLSDNISEYEIFSQPEFK